MTKKRKFHAMTTALIVDGAYAHIQGRALGGKIDYTKLRTELEEANLTEFEQCWYFDSMCSEARRNGAFHQLKYARPRGPQFNVEVYSTKPYNCRCTKCGHRFSQNVQKGVDNGIATKLLTLTLTDNIERIVLISGDGDFYSSLRHVRFEQKKEVWVVGFWGSVSGDLQQLASRIIWIDDLWGRVKYHDHGLVRRTRHEMPSSRRLSTRSERDRYSRDSQRPRVLSPRRTRSERSPERHRHSPEIHYRLLTGLDASFEYDQVNLSDSEDEDDNWSPPLSPSSPSGRSSEYPMTDANLTSLSASEATAVGSRSSVAVLNLNGGHPPVFPLPMPVPVAASTAITERVDPPRPFSISLSATMRRANPTEPTAMN